jgi:DNA-binding HxlR family transcriptional regulator
LRDATLNFVLPRTYDSQNCSIARTLELMGERWTMLVLREAFLGRRRFDEYAERLGIARNVLSARLAHLVEEGVLAKVR